MDVLQIAIALLGALSVFLGYRLFCESPVRMLSGALLALFGVGILGADLVAVRGHAAIESHPATHQTRPADVNRHKASHEWFV